eukprot:gnl/MRDRNA2_/MRDRNA2_107074_c0_seq1.p1 gnl/MRDRNA2_/MRDRNA2_107074_c0~~gnl/MRDRNA2_/MRDRNA2_107074_c0_seq1.p1  ORF type:complete len:384 (+),score=86.49 gnl/MRDRNA2_/MRDRNA2_107074_c0_seq1:63-1214(+)
MTDSIEALDGVTARWAKEEGSDVCWCGQEAALLQALDAGERRLELGDMSGEELARCVTEICRVFALGRIDQLSFAACSLSETHLGELANALPGSRLQAFGISGLPSLPLGAWRGLWEVLPLTITKLDFGENHFSDEALADLCRALGKEERDSLEELFLDENCFTNVVPVIEAFQALPELSWLDLGDNRLDDAAVLKLCDSLPATKLSCLVLGTNNIQSQGASRLFATLPSMPTLELLYLDHTGTDDEALAMLGSFIQDVSLKELHLDSSKITDRGVRDLCTLLARSTIDFLDVSDNNLSDATVSMVKEVLGMDNFGVEDGEEVVSGEEPANETIRQEIQDGPKEGRGSSSRAQGKGGGKGKGQGQGKGGYAGDGGSGMDVDRQ